MISRHLFRRSVLALTALGAAVTLVSAAEPPSPSNMMFVFGFRWLKGTSTFACSHDLVTRTKWDGEPLVKPSEPFDKTFAHKPWVMKHDGVVYHFYCAVGDQGRAIALATSKDLKPAPAANP